MSLNVEKLAYSLLPVLFLLSLDCQQKEQDSKKFSNYSGLNLQPVIAQRKNAWKEKKGAGEVIAFNLQEGQRYYQLSNFMEWQGYTLLSDSVLVGTVDELTFWHDRIFIFDRSGNKSVHCFATDGRHLFSIDRPGEGPGEFTNLCGFAINERNGNLFLLDNYTIIKYDQDGEFLQEVRIPLAAEDLEVSEDGKHIYLYVLNNAIPSPSHTFNLWVITNEDQPQVVSNNFSFPLQEAEISFNIKTYFSHAPHSARLLRILDDNIYEITNKTIRPRYTMDYQSLSAEEQDPVVYDPFTSDKIWGPDLFFEEAEHAIVFSASGIQQYITLYDKVQRTSTSYAIPTIVDDYLGSIFMMPKGGHRNGFVFAVEPRDLYDLTEVNLADSEIPQKMKQLAEDIRTSDRFNQLLAQTNKDSNPILIFLNPK